jgi:hypothetical protein
VLQGERESAPALVENGPVQAGFLPHVAARLFDGSLGAGGHDDSARGAWLLGSQLGNILQTLCDRAIAAGVSAAAGTVLAETGVGAIVGYALAALMIADMLALISRAAFKIQTFGGMILALFGSGMDFFGQGGDLSNLRPPTVTYSLPGA